MHTSTRLALLKRTMGRAGVSELYSKNTCRYVNEPSLLHGLVTNAPSTSFGRAIARFAIDSYIISSW